MDNSYNASKMRKVMEEAAHIKKSYDTAKQGILDEYEGRKKVLRDLEERFKEALEAFNRGEVSKNAYNKLKKDRERAEKTFNEVKEKLDEIDSFMNARLEKVMIQLNEIKEKYAQEVIEESRKMKYQILKAKYDFLVNAANIRYSYTKLGRDDSEFQQLYEDLGLELGLDAFNLVTDGVIDETGSVITKEELYDVIHKGKIPYQLEDEVKYAEKQGYLS